MEEHHHEHEAHIPEVHHHSEKPMTEKIRSNPWILSTVILGIFAVILIIASFNTGVTGNVISEDDAAQIIIDFAKSQTGQDVGLVGVAENAGLYEVTILYQNQSIPLYITKDGKNLVQGLTPLEAITNPEVPEEPAATEVPKTDKPVVEAFIFSYCPYGLQFEKALIPVYNLLKNKADFKIIAIGAMHGEYEKVESLRQICVEENYGKDKLFSYLKAFDESSEIGACSGNGDCLKPLVQKIFTSLGIDEAKITTCMADDAQAIYETQGARANELGISGSPTFVINGVKSQVARTPAAIKDAVCSAFTEVPSECSQNVSSSSASAGFGASASSSASSASCG